MLPVDEGGPGVYILPNGIVDVTKTIGDWLLDIEASANTGAFVLGNNTSGLSSSIGSNGGKIKVGLFSLPDTTYSIGNVDGTRLEIKDLSAAAFLALQNGKEDYGVNLSASDVSLFLAPDEGDSFINRLLPTGGTEVHFALNVGWAKSRGLYFGGNAGLRDQVSFNNGLGPKFLNLKSLVYEIKVSDKLFVVFGASAQSQLGPVTATVESIGLKAELKKADEIGNVGPFDLDFSFKAPTGVGIAVESDILKGGGYLSIDPANHRYAGIANLTFRDKLTLNAVGILQTELPDQQDGYSLLLLITAQFAPIQLGLGFTLNGVGGLVGVNRTLNIPYLREQVRAGRMDRLLFPANVLDNPTEVLSTVESSFPAAEGRYVFGLMAKIGWGTPRLITLDAALILELPSPVRLALLGVLQAILPDEAHPIVRLRADFLGSIDFGAKKVAFDATLTDSKILQFALTGDAAFRLYSGENPVFVLTSGGFHPAFQPPANADLPTLRRLTLALANTNDLKIILTSYLALTSNTVQFGSRLDLFLDLPFGFYVEGFMGFDVLFQFHPFRVAAYVGAGVAIKRKGSTKLGIYLSLNVTGPAPWHVVGEASFKVLGFKIKARINSTFGRSAAERLEAVNVHTLFTEALNAAGNWEMELPTGATSNAAVLRSVPEGASNLLLDPSGALVFRQKLVPLGYQLEKFSNASVAGNNRFDITEIKPLQLNGTAIQSADNEEVTDFFAPEQFRRMSDAQKLSAPSFQRMRSGLRLRGLNGLVGGSPVQKVVEYEHVVMSRPATSGVAALSADVVAADSAATPAEVVATTLPPVKPTEATYRKLAKNSSIGRAYLRTRTSARAPRPITWQEDAYAVVYARNLSLYTEAASFPSEAEATAYLQQQVANRAVQASELLVVPAYQLALV
ncbi:hypothetical protein K3G63_22440 [Hymenobacter sp. HSC-4F20]|uniref:DUF6603 domain-containing protein n=1 Tax=Hymenobacter sp. HSC-4F20 TaxID=2864135 RepID=UPI001C73BFAB|nr:DUF6603 domain-containing protein [Hymenobacter sp. HSC-4F20]MBX0293221.1 hypothetical protein [Hymenobacter sp. HSC-4F20]